MRSAPVTRRPRCSRSSAPTASRSPCGLPVRPDVAARLIRLGVDPVGAPLEAGLACLVVHSHAPDFSWQRNFQVRGDLIADDDGWALAPHKLVGGFELPPGSAFSRLRINAKKARRYHKVAKAELARRAAARQRG